MMNIWDFIVSRVTELICWAHAGFKTGSRDFVFLNKGLWETRLRLHSLP